ncbi:pantoate--beta-alanine ligase [Pararhodobacter sp.]|uniref:pantoate--beta-alanine ligase n=1 Tax=Pararhodobacter sp. TaxID=2127056 RepID=UPI002AFE92CB|nr:pantoate--beta-alanine ligase [Pararhodobacter sp.]
MHICRTIADIRTTTAGFRAAGESVALVPTMGYLHAGHMALVERAKSEGQRVVTTIFVNPTQFGANEDLSTYPRDEARDLAMLQAAGVNAVFLPEVAEIYPEGAQTIVETTDLAKILIGKLRPGHFRGVATVVTKLFNIIQPDVACFGEKDYQQLCVIRQFTRDLNIPVRIVGVPTVREADGLAMSSRNVRLTPQDRAAAVILSRALTQAADLAKTGITASRLRAWVAAHIQSEPRADLQSADIRDAQTLRSISGPLKAPAVILLAVKFGAVLLIDQRVVTP